jgi:hypothetical protein
MSGMYMGVVAAAIPPPAAINDPSEPAELLAMRLSLRMVASRDGPMNMPPPAP